MWTFKPSKFLSENDQLDFMNKLGGVKGVTKKHKLNPERELNKLLESGEKAMKNYVPRETGVDVRLWYKNMDDETVFIEFIIGPRSHYSFESEVMNGNVIAWGYRDERAADWRIYTNFHDRTYGKGTYGKEKERLLKCRQVLLPSECREPVLKETYNNGQNL